MMLRRGGLVALVLIAVSCSAVTPASAQPDAAKIYQKSCSLCHGKEGEPNAVFAKQGVKNFKDAAWQEATTDATIEQAIREGKKGTMMASFRTQLKPEEIKALVRYIRKLGGAKK